jgi:ankyrin repeat protein
MSGYRTYTVHELTKQNKVSILEQILDEKPELLDTLDEKGLHCIHIAAYMGEVPLVNELIRRGANKDLLRSDGMSPILIAAMRGHEQMVIYLAKQGANCNVKGPMGYSTLHFLCMKGLIGSVRELLEPRIGAAINCRTDEESTPLHAAISGNHLNLALLLINKGASKNVTNKSGKTPLMCLKAKEGDANRREVLEALER